jgi:hypothetical protein
VSKLIWHSPTDLLGELARTFSIGMFITGESTHPRYQLIALSEEKAWIRDVRSGTDHVMPTPRCRKF